MSKKKKLPHYTDNLYSIGKSTHRNVFLFIDAETGEYNNFFVRTLQSNLTAYQYAKYRNALSKIIDEMDSILEDVELPFNKE